MLVAILFSLGCGTTPQKKESSPATESSVTEETPADLKECPCGRSNWEELPPGYKKAPK